MKILLAMDAFPPIIDGAVTALMNLTSAYQKKGHVVSFLIPSHLGTANQNGYETFKAASIPFPTYKPYRLVLPWFSSVGRRASKTEFDIVHAHSPFGIGMLARNLAVERRIPCVYTFHTLFAEASMQYTDFFEKLVIKRPIRTFLRRVSDSFDQVITPSEPVKHLLRSYGVKNDIEVIPTGLDPKTVTSNIKGDIRKKYNIQPDVPILLFVGRLGTEKNMGLLFDTLQIVSRRGLAFHLVIVGDGPARGDFHKMAEKRNIEERITFTGTISQKDLIDCYSGSDLFCMPSLIESQCLAAVEAMMNRVPVLASRAMGLQQTVKEGVNGLLVEPNPESFAQALSQLIQDREMRERLGEGALRLSKEMTNDSCAEKHLQVYERLIKDYERLIKDGVGIPKKPLRYLPLIVKSLAGV